MDLSQTFAFAGVFLAFTISAAGVIVAVYLGRRKRAPRDLSARTAMGMSSRQRRERNILEWAALLDDTIKWWRLCAGLGSLGYACLFTAFVLITFPQSDWPLALVIVCVAALIAVMNLEVAERFSKSKQECLLRQIAEAAIMPDPLDETKEIHLG